MLGCNESKIVFQQHLCKLGQLRRNSQVLGQAMKYFRTFCELVEGEENKLTTWTIVLGCNIILQQHLCKLGQLRRSNGRNSQVLGQAMKYFRTFCELVEGEENKLNYMDYSVRVQHYFPAASLQAMVEIHKYSVKQCQ